MVRLCRGWLRIHCRAALFCLAEWFPDSGMSDRVYRTPAGRVEDVEEDHVRIGDQRRPFDVSPWTRRGARRIAAGDLQLIFKPASVRSIDRRSPQLGDLGFQLSEFVLSRI